MNAQQLRNSILQEAIEGRLVPQDPNDEPASVLLERIREEKKRLVKEGKLKKKDLEETPISEDEKPFEIPESWEWCKLNDLCIFLSRGKSPSYSDVPTNYPVFAQKCNLKDGGISLEQARFLKPETVSKWQEEYHLRTDDVLVNSTGTGTVCRTRLFNENCLGNYPFTVPDSHVSVVRTSNNICSTYIFYLFNSKIYQDYWEDRLAGSTNQKELYIGVLQNTPIPLPPLAEQKRIVAKIEELLPKVEEYGKAQDALNKLNEELPEKLKKSVLQEAIEGRLVPQDPNDEPASVLLNRIREEKKRFYKAGLLKKKEIIEREIYEDEVPFTLPDGWLWTKIDNVAFVTKLAGFEYTKYIADNLVPKENGIPLFKGKNVQNGKIVYEFEAYIPVELSNELKRSQINKKCLLTPYVGTIGNIGIHDKSGVYHLGSNVGKIEFYNGDNLNILEEYVKYYLMSSYGYDELTKYKKATAQESISIEAIRDVFLPLPPLSEQKRIVEKLEQLLGEIEKLKK